jgi:hypothetical protein
VQMIPAPSLQLANSLVDEPGSFLPGRLLTALGCHDGLLLDGDVGGPWLVSQVAVSLPVSRNAVWCHRVGGRAPLQPCTGSGHRHETAGAGDESIQLRGLRCFECCFSEWSAWAPRH